MKTVLPISDKGIQLLKLILVCILLLFLASCSAGKKTFSPELVYRYDLCEDDLKGLLFYTRNTLEITREVDGNFRQLISGNRLIHRKGKTYEVIKIKKGTPGILSFKQGDSLLISFAGQRNVLFTPDRMERLYTTATEASDGMIQIGNQLFECSGDLRLAINYATYKKMDFPGYLSEGR